MDNDSLTVKQAADLLNVSEESLRRYTRFWGHHMSTTANPPKGQERRFTREDVRLLSWCREKTRDGATWRQVDSQIPLIEPGELPTWADLTGSQQDTANESTAIETPNRLLLVLEKMADTSTTAERQQSEIGQLRAELAEMRAELATVKAMLTDMQRASFWDRLTGRKPPA